jgi:hypothetical protein
MKARTLLICLICTLLLPVNAPGKGHPITWDPKKIEQTITLGEAQQITATFTCNKDLQDIRPWVVPELEPFIFSVEPQSFPLINRNTPYTVILNVLIPFDTQIGLYNGTVHLRPAQGSKTYARPLPIELNIENATALVLDVTLDEPNSVSAEVTPEEGVKMETTAADGTHYILDIPPNAIRGTEKVTVTVTPVLDIENLPLTGGFMAAVHFAPEGLLLYKAAILSIELPTLVSSDELMGFSYQGLGNKIHFFPILPLGITSSSFAVEIIHFSGAGIGTGCPPCNWTDSTTSDGYRQRMSCLMNEACVLGWDSGDPLLRNRLRSTMRAWFLDLVLPTIKAATTMKELDDAGHGFMLWEQTAQQFGIDDYLLPELNTGKEEMGLAVKRIFSVLLENLNAANTVDAVRKAHKEVEKWFEAVQRGGYENYLTDELSIAQAAICNAYERGLSYLDAYCRAASEHCEKLSLSLTFVEFLAEAQFVCSDAGSDISIYNFCGSIMTSFLSSVSIDKDDIKPIIIGEELEVHATPENIDKQPLDLPVTWGIVEVSVANIVEVVNDNTVRIRGEGEGKTTLAVNVFECDTIFSDDVEIEVEAPSVKLNPEEATLPIGDTLELTATMIDADGKPLEGYTFTWSSSNPDVASINPESGSSTLVSAKSTGIATITAETAEGYSATAVITVEQMVVSLVPSERTISVGDPPLILEVEVKNDNGEVIECPSKILWTFETDPVGIISFVVLSDDTKAGVTGVETGIAEIVATCEGVPSAPASITVVAVAGAPYEGNYRLTWRVEWNESWSLGCDAPPYGNYVSDRTESKHVLWSGEIDYYLEYINEPDGPVGYFANVSRANIIDGSLATEKLRLTKTMNMFDPTWEEPCVYPYEYESYYLAETFDFTKETVMYYMSDWEWSEHKIGNRQYGVSLQDIYGDAIREVTTEYISEKKCHPPHDSQSSSHYVYDDAYWPDGYWLGVTYASAYNADDRYHYLPAVDQELTEYSITEHIIIDGVIDDPPSGFPYDCDYWPTPKVIDVFIKIEKR